MTGFAVIVAAVLAATADPTTDHAAVSWSHDSSLIVFVGRLNASYELVAASTTQRSRKVLARSQNPIISPVCSPDGSAVAYVGADGARPTERQLHVVNVTGADDRVVTSSSRDAVSASVCWSPAGGLIAVGGWLKGDAPPAVYTMLNDGSMFRRISRTTERACLPAWSPDGTRIAYYAQSEGRLCWDLCVALADGTGHRLVDEGVLCGPYATTVPLHVQPAWSPDSGMLAYVKSREGRPADTDVCVLKLGTGDSIRVSPPWCGGFSPTWSPDSRRLAICYAAKEGGSGILAVDVQRTSRKLLWNGLANFGPAWSPNASTVAVLTSTPLMLVPQLIRVDTGIIDYLPEDHAGRVAILHAKARFSDDPAAARELEKTANELSFHLNSPEALRQAGDAYLATYDYTAATRCYRKAELAADPLVRDAAHRGLILAILHSHDLSTPASRQALETADLPVITDQEKKAIGELLRIDKQERGPQAALDSAMVYEHDLALPATAAALYDKVVKLYPQWKRTLEAVDGYLRVEPRKNAEAVDWLSLAAAAERVKKESQREIAVKCHAAALQGNYRKALKHALKLDAAAPAQPEVQSLMAAALKKMGELAEQQREFSLAASFYGKAAGIDTPLRWACLLGQARCQRETGLHLNAVEAFGQAAAAAADTAALNEIYTALLARSGYPAYDLAIADFHAKLGLTAEAAAMQANLLHQSPPADVAAFAKRNLQQNSSLLAEHYESIGLFRLAADSLFRSAAIARDPGSVLLKTADLYLRAGLDNEAQMVCEKLVDEYPDSSEARKAQSILDGRAEKISD